MKITEALLAEHLVFHHIFDHIEAQAPKLRTMAEVRALAGLVESILAAHSHTEDELFIGPLEHCFEEFGQRDAFLEEHKEMNGHVARVRNATTVAKARECLLAAVAYSREHFDREERLVFPLAERVLKGDTLVTLGQAWVDERLKPRRKTA